MSSSELKQKAKEMLDGKKKKAALVLLLYFIVVGIINTLLSKLFPGQPVYTYGEMKIEQLSPLGQLIDFILTVFFSLGIANYYMKLARGEEASFGDIFSKGSILPKAVVISFVGGIVIGLGFVALIIPGIILVFAYSMINYIYIDDPSTGIIETLEKSRKMMKGHKWDFFCLLLSFLGWMILGVFTLGILYFWLLPYINVTQVLFYDSIKGDKGEKEVEIAPTEE